MTKLIEIPFDASLIGQEGIVVKYRNGETPDFVKVYGEYIMSIDSDGAWLTNNLNGRFSSIEDARDLIMYRESKVMTVEEWIATQKWKDDPEFVSGWLKGTRELAAAIKEGLVEL